MEDYKQWEGKWVGQDVAAVGPAHLKLPFQCDADRLGDDVARFSPDEWTPHFNTYNYEGDWSVLPLRAAKGALVPAYPDPAASEGFVDTELMSRCDYVPEILKKFQCELQTVRFLKLAAGSVITRHRDHELGLEDGLVRIHIPAVTNDKVDFVLNDERLAMRPGEAWYTNVNYFHSVKNRGETDRIHLVIDCVVNDWVRSFFE